MRMDYIEKDYILGLFNEYLCLFPQGNELLQGITYLCFLHVYKF